MGSTIAQQIALRHPRLARSLVLMCPWARCDRYARDVFAHLAHAKARLRPEEFSVYLQLLIFTKPYWDRDESYREMTEGRQAAARRILFRSRFTASKARRPPAWTMIPLASLGRSAAHVS